jgi:predicted hotdog family 3-hydroxylacyl-ACP dehydratase
MCFIEELASCDDKTASATAHFEAGHFAEGALEFALVECAAQSAAAALGHRAKHAGGQSGAAAHGMLAAVNSFQIQSPPPLGKKLLIEVYEVRRFGPMMLISAIVSCAGQKIACGQLTLYA